MTLPDPQLPSLRALRLPLLALVLGILCLISGYPPRSHGQTPTAQPQAQQADFAFPPPPQGSGAPRGRRQGGASRGSCQQYERFTALVPRVEEFVWGVTTADHPVLWFHIPESLAEARSAEFVVQDQENAYLYRTELDPTDLTPGVVSIAIPPQAPALQIGEIYQWTFSIYCDPDQPSSLVYLQGGIQRIALDADLQARLSAASPLEQSRLYASAGIWHEALTTLGQQRRQQPERADLMGIWRDLLEQTDLGELASEPLSSCCQTDP